MKSCAFLGQQIIGRIEMDDPLRATARSETAELSIAGVSWAAVLAGAAASLAITLVLLSFGAGMGFAVVADDGSWIVSLNH